MFVVVQHTVSDPAAFQARGQDLLANIPQGLKSHQFLPATDGNRAACLWEGDSLDAVRGYIDSTLGSASSQEYFAVAEQYALGLPQAAQATKG